MSVEGRAFIKLLRDEVAKSLNSMPDVKASWESSRRWSEFMLGSSQSRAASDYGALGRVGYALGYDIQAEYLRVDQIWYSSSSESHDDWVIDAFIEHENDYRKISQTVRKLLQLGSGLKVLVTYPEGNPVDKILRTASGLIEKRYGTPPETRLLLVLGALSNSSPAWKAWEFDGVGRSLPLEGKTQA